MPCTSICAAAFDGASRGPSAIAEPLVYYIVARMVMVVAITISIYTHLTRLYSLWCVEVRFSLVVLSVFYCVL